MGVRGRSPKPVSNLVFEPELTLPYPMEYGTISWSQSYNGLGSADIQYNQVSSDAIADLLIAYGKDLPTIAKPPRITIYGVEFEVRSLNYTRDQFFPEDGHVETFSVSVSLEQVPPKVVPGQKVVKPTANTYKFYNWQMISDGQNTIGRLDEGFNDAELTFGEAAANDEIPGFPRALLVPEPEDLRVQEEGDEDLTTPPPNTYVLRDTTSNFDESGPKKIKKISTRVNGQLIREEVLTYGFAYLMQDIHKGDGILYNSSPADFWTQIEYRKTTYTYQSPGATTLQVDITLPDSTGGQRRVNFLIAPGFESVAAMSALADLPIVSFKSNIEYLVQQETTGWSLFRLKKETEQRSSIFPDDPYYPYFFFHRIPFYSKTAYLLESTRLTYGDNIQPPFTVQWVNYEELPENYKQRFGKDDRTEDGRVAILYPDPNYVEPFFARAEYSCSNSFAWAFDPEGEANPDQFIPGTDRRAPRPRFTTGQESYSRVIRRITGKDSYTEYVVEYSSQDPGFDNSAERFSFREMSGRPPDGQSRTRRIEVTERPINRRQDSSGRDRRWLVSTSNANQFPRGGSVSVPNANTIDEAKVGVQNQMREAHRQNSQAQRTLSWFYPEIRANDLIELEGDRWQDKGKWYVNQIQWSLEYSGRTEDGTPLIVCPGTQLSLGLSREEPITVRSAINPDASNGSGATPEPQLDTDLLAATFRIGLQLPPLPTRRNF